MRIALLGSIPKGDDIRADWVDWKVEYSKYITRSLPDATIVDGDALSDNAGPELVVGHDLWQVKHADICIVDGRTRVGAGTAQEIVLAKYFKKPVIAVLPKDTHHRKTNVTFHGVTVKDWIHPFLYMSSDYIAQSIEDAVAWIKQYMDSPANYQIKDLAVFLEAINHYETTRPIKK